MRYWTGDWPELPQRVRKDSALRAHLQSSSARSSSLQTIYYVAQDTVYSMPASGGPPVRLTEGEDLTIDPPGRMLLVQTSRGMVRVHLLQHHRAADVCAAGRKLQP
jgi:hypothetical protein